jgi:hypothetical protein
MEKDDFEFIPPKEIVSVERDQWWDSYADDFKEELGGLRFYNVKFKCERGLIYNQSTWALDEVDAYNRVMGNTVITSFTTEEQTND